MSLKEFTPGVEESAGLGWTKWLLLGLGAILFFMFVSYRRKKRRQAFYNDCREGGNGDCLDEVKIYVGGKLNVLVRQASRYANAAEQDLNPLVALLHAYYAAGYMGAVSDLVTPAEFDAQRFVMTWQQFSTKIKGIQDSTTEKAVKACPELAKHLDPMLALMGRQS
jgi:hypothetical protein